MPDLDRIKETESEDSEDIVEKHVDEDTEDDLFDEVFGDDPEKEQAKQKMNQKVREQKEKEEAKKTKKKEPITEKIVLETENKKEEVKTVKEKPENKKKTAITKEKTEKEKKKEMIKEETDDGTDFISDDHEDLGNVKENLEDKAIQALKSLENDGDSLRPDLKLLPGTKANTSFIGRKKSIQGKYGDTAGLFVGKVSETNSENNILLDSMNPHVVFVCGARGGGKSYLMGIIAEELALKNSNVAGVVIDPIGVFWSMRYPNREERELELLKKWNLKPQGLENLYVFVPKGVENETPRDTFDNTFSVQPSMLTSQDWCLTFGIDRFSPSGLMMETALAKVKKGYTSIDGQVIKGFGKAYDIDDITLCMEKDSELNSREKGFKPDSVRALVSRFEAAKSWGIFDKEGTPLAEICREGQLTVIDTSFLDENVTALIIGLLARRILAARKLTTRKEAAKKFEQTTNVKELLEIDIPPTWLMIDEAHTLIPSGNIKTPATDSVIEYVKQGRRPGCSLVFATQQPSAIDTRVLSQLDIIFVHKLVFNDDIKAVIKRTPTIVPLKYKHANFIKTLPLGFAITGDRNEESSRAFKVQIRPRMSQHEGREAETIDLKRKLKAEQVLEIALEMAMRPLRRNGKVSYEELDKILAQLNDKYSSNAKQRPLIELLIEKGCIEEKEGLILPVEKEEAIKELEIPEERPKKKISEDLEKTAEQLKELQKEPKVKIQKLPEEIQEMVHEKEETQNKLALAPQISQGLAQKMLDKLRGKKILGLIGNEERLEEIQLKGIPVLSLEFNFYKSKQDYRKGKVFVNAFTGEFLHFVKNKFEESQGLKKLYNLSKEELKALNSVGRNEKIFKAVLQRSEMSESALKENLQKLIKAKMVEERKGTKETTYVLKEKIDLPSSPFHEMHGTLNQLHVREQELSGEIKGKYSKEQAIQILQKIWPALIVQNVSTIYWPIWEGQFKKINGKTRTVYLDAVTGKELNL
ncbi:MAG: DUF87 domain-containing protein [Candidatus Diapherotrites archaeon]|nr:DUF87 domain-containing protein [Candidatus Diapherotrites archaeon]